MTDSEFLPLILFGSLILLMFVFVIGSFVIIQKQKHQRAIVEKRETEQRYQNEMLHVKLEVQEQSLNMVSREIHDNIGQVLSIVRMQLFNAARLDSLDTTQNQVLNSVEMLGNAINELRNLSHVLNGEMISRLGIVAAIEKELTFTNSVYPVKGTFRMTGEEIHLSAEQELLLFRIVQQSIGNIHRHASATTFNVNLDYQPGKIQIEILDDGSGFDVTKLAKANGIGLMNIRERAKMLGGEVNFGNNKEQGAYVNITLNLN